MLKKRESKHPIFRAKLTTSQKASDKLTFVMGSWPFIIIFLIYIFLWLFLNGFFLINYLSGKPFDPFPFILLNLTLSCLAALQAPIILMSQNRQMEKDRISAKYDYAVNRKAEREIEDMQKDLEKIKRLIKNK